MQTIYVDYPLGGDVYAKMTPGPGRLLVKAITPSDMHHLKPQGKLFSSDMKLDNVLFEVIAVGKNFDVDLEVGDLVCIAAPGMDLLDSGTLTVVVQAPDVLGHWPRAAFAISDDEAAKRIKANKDAEAKRAIMQSGLVPVTSGLVGV